jgi:hypothetical protein
VSGIIVSGALLGAMIALNQVEPAVTSRSG